MEFIEEILKVMNERNISAYQLEEMTGLAHSTISSWKRGSTPTIDKAIKVIKYLGLSADEVFDLKQNATTTPSEKSQYIRIGREQARHAIKVIDIIDTENDKEEIMQYLNGLRMYLERQIEKYNEWDKHTMEHP